MTKHEIVLYKLKQQSKRRDSRQMTALIDQRFREHKEAGLVKKGQLERRCLYFVGNDYFEVYKVGVFDLSLVDLWFTPAALRIEAVLLETFNDCRLRGEWMELNAKQVENFRAFASQLVLKNSKLDGDPDLSVEEKEKTLRFLQRPRMHKRRGNPAILASHVAEITELRAKGMTYEMIGKRFGVTRQAIFHVCSAHSPVSG